LLGFASGTLLSNNSVEDKDMTDEPNPEQPVQQIQHSSATARIPDEIGRGVFATAVIVLHGTHEYTIDFVQSLARPNRVASRIVLPPAVANQFVLALEQALEKYRASFGEIPHEPKSQQQDQGQSSEKDTAPSDISQPEDTTSTKPVTENTTSNAPTSESNSSNTTQSAPIADIYDNLKLPDDMLGGVYANMASISHTGSEFCFDFIAQFFPRSAVTARVYMAAPRVPELLNSLKRSINAK
jgi:hypothetical protein